MRMQALDAFVEAIEAAEDCADLWRAVGSCFSDEGVKRLSYHHFHTPAAGGGAEVSVRGWPDALAHDYVEEERYRDDPMPRTARQVAEPFHWQDVADLSRLSAGEAELLRWMRERDMGEGLAVPVFGPMGRDGYLGLAFKDTRHRVAPPVAKVWQAVCQLAHLRYCRLSPEDVPRADALTGREREVLTWIARGKSNGVIAELLGCSPHTVDSHVRRIFRKLEVSDRITAAVRAAGSGLVMN